MKYIYHGTFICGTNIIKAEGHDLIKKYAPWYGKGSFVLILGSNPNLIIA